MLCILENTSRAYSGLKCHKELHTDLISLDYLLFIKPFSTHANIGSVWQRDRVFSEAHLLRANDRLEALSQPINTR